jgi:L-threonylcarbamoyladenylate synthase
MDGRIPLILDGGPCRYGVESTVLSLVGEPTILRPGAITREMLEAVIGPVRLAPSILEPLGAREVAASPGMKYKHYAPDADVHVIEGEPKAAAKRIRSLYYEYESEGERVAILGTDQTMPSYRNLTAYSLGDHAEPETLCANLFTLLRDVGSENDVILAEGVDTRETGLAFMNRLLRAAGFQRETV